MLAKKEGIESHKRSDAGGRITSAQEYERRTRERRGEATSLDGASESKRYRWQFKEADSCTWRNFGSSDNVVLENLYCGVENVEVNIKLKDTTIRHFRKRLVKMSANFQTMSMSLISTSKQFLIRRCSTPSYIKERNNEFPTLWVWYWEDIDGWKKYAETGLCSGTKQEQIEISYLNGDLSYLFQIGGKDFIIHFEDDLMNQRSADTDVQAGRLVRRRPMFVSESTLQTTKSGIPEGQAMNFERTNLDKDCKAYRTVSQSFHKTMPEHQASILMVEEITNDDLFHKYKRELKNMKKKGKPWREKLLFHGTTSDVVDAICTQNFDPGMCGKNGTQYGHGCYFAVDASYSNNYSITARERTRYMFLAKVLTGEFKRGEQSFYRPPLKDPSNPAGDVYDSCVDDENQPKIFLIFNDEQCYPLYLIKYQLL
ncbi:TCDD-inducible poly [ADP-ribose] polymerase-like isoform X2 [Stylophora pistillata]|uniref:TCDD-inducible poly [ADP-ribose] polymerase-like isoform X2 n=1 Tax=Stylophora pistillata TaxID=50429 RepID=UPI000C0467E1|nr:TCDD-inducible poly [ADP-ribose] polymerase-like isoform X2 [Stylophora pistillata]